jgi:hypothetical protein
MSNQALIIILMLAAGLFLAVYQRDNLRTENKVLCQQLIKQTSSAPSSCFK